MKTRLTERLGIEHPLVQAPMAFVSGGLLARTVSDAGGLGMIGGGYGDDNWLLQQFALAQGAQVGCGFITWALAQKPHLLDLALDHGASSIFLSFGDPAPFAEKVRGHGATLICQVQTLRDARRAIEVGADVIVAQGSDAGGHGAVRGTMALVPEIADEIARSGHDVALCAAGGIADGRGIAAALMLGADGVVLGTRFLATAEALIHPQILAKALDADGDETLRTRVVDLARQINWPEGYSGRVLVNDFITKWHGQEQAFEALQKQEPVAWAAAVENGDTTVATPFVGEAIGLISDAPSAKHVLQSLMDQTRQCLETKIGL